MSADMKAPAVIAAGTRKGIGIRGVGQHDAADFAGRGDEIDGLLRAAAQHWSLERLSGTDRAVLRAAVAELVSRQGTPARVVIDEAIEIAKAYGSEESGRFVNAVLDRIARELRPAEFP